MNLEDKIKKADTAEDIGVILDEIKRLKKMTTNKLKEITIKKFAIKSLSDLKKVPIEEIDFSKTGFKINK